MTPTQACSHYERRFNVIPFGDPHMPSQFVDSLEAAIVARDWMLANSSNPWLTVKIYDTVDGLFY